MKKVRAGTPQAVYASLVVMVLMACSAAVSRPASTAPAVASQSLAAELAVARAAGARLRVEYPPGFVIYPKLVSSDGSDSNAVIFDPSRVTKLSEALRDGANARYLDTLATRDPVRLKMMPDSARYYFSLAGIPEVWRDSARIAVFSGVALKEPGEVSMNVMRYLFVRDGSAWRFAKRVLIYAT